MSNIKKAYTAFVELYNKYEEALKDPRQQNVETYKLGLYNDMMELYEDVLYNELQSGSTLTNSQKDKIMDMYDAVTKVNNNNNMNRANAENLEYMTGTGPKSVSKRRRSKKTYRFKALNRYKARPKTRRRHR